MKTFKCPMCGSNLLEEIMTGVTQTSLVNGVEEDGFLDYGSSSTEGGEVTRYQCSECGRVLPGIENNDDMAGWLMKYGEEV